MDASLWHCTGDRDQDRPQEKEMQTKQNNEKKQNASEDALQMPWKEVKSKWKSKDIPTGIQSSQE